MTLFALIYALYFAEDWVNPSSSSSCTTPDEKSGTCINIANCAVLVQMLQNAPKPIPQDIALFLRRSQCGFEGSRVNIYIFINSFTVFKYVVYIDI